MTAQNVLQKIFQFIFLKAHEDEKLTDAEKRANLDKPEKVNELRNFVWNSIEEYADWKVTDFADWLTEKNMVIYSPITDTISRNDRLIVSNEMLLEIYLSERKQK